MRSLLGAAAVAVLVRHLLAGGAVDLGVTTTGWSGLALAAGIALGLCLTRVRPVVGGLMLAVAVPARGYLGDFAIGALGTGEPGLGVAVALSLFPAGLALGIAARGLIGAHVALALGWCLGEISVMAGALSWLPGRATGALAAVLLWLLARPRSVPAAPGRDAEPGTSLPEPVFSQGVLAALMLGGAFGLLVINVQRVLPGYTAPAAHAGSQVVVWFLLPAALVAWPSGILAGRGWGARVLGALGAAAFGLTVLFVLDWLGFYAGQQHIDLGRKLRALSQTWASTGWTPTDGLTIPMPSWLLPWDVWLGTYAGWAAAALGVVLGTLRGRAAASFALGVGLAAAATSYVVVDPVLGPTTLLLVAAGLGMAAAPTALLGGWGLLGLPLLFVPFWLRPLEQRVGFDEMRRPGEYAAESFARGALLDVTMFSTPDRWTSSMEGVVAFHGTSLGREPTFFMYEDSLHRLGVQLTRAQQEQTGTGPPRYFGLRVGGVALHGDHPSTGAEGSVGRMTRLFASPGRVFVGGLGGALIAADLADAELAGEVLLGTSAAMPGAERFKQLLLLVCDQIDSSGFEGEVFPDPVLAARRALSGDHRWRAGTYDTVVVAPQRPEWPYAHALLAREHVARLAELLSPEGRCLAWVDTTGLDARALRARMAAFGAVFGNQCLALLEPRGLDAPFVLLVGWNDPRAHPITGSAPVAAGDGTIPAAFAQWRTGERSRIATLTDLAQHLLLDGHGLRSLAEAGSIHGRDGVSMPGRAARGGWTAVGGVWDSSARLSERDDRPHTSTGAMPQLLRALAQHELYSYHLEFVNQTVLEVRGDIDWDAFDVEVEQYVQAASADPTNPLLHMALASFLEPLALLGDYQRFARVFEATGAESMDCWRLAVLQSHVLMSMLEEERGFEAMARARRIAGLPALAPSRSATPPPEASEGDGQ